MKLRPLILDEDTRREILRVRQHADRGPLPLAASFRAIANPDLAVGNNPQHVCVVPVGAIAVQELAKEFGFRGGLEDYDRAWVEDITPSKVAVNVVQRVQTSGQQGPDKSKGL